MDYRIEKLITKIQSETLLTSNDKQTAESIAVSVSRLRHLFKKGVGASLAKYIKNLRMEKARIQINLAFLKMALKKYQSFNLESEKKSKKISTSKPANPKQKEN